ncbi:glycosyltransferase [Candidatus Solirubrobacter pratensis]|uniref:glycosyltransferase n=1 Tax=Candidatus Solirubrobacter pratensis TaxID=1298857 RepID=UPI0003F7348E|nr:glycosyltransferase [Candidatus Solirubrobacter pratensis]
MARVALICEPPDGGVAEHVRLLALGLSAYGHEPVVFGPPDLAGAGGLEAFHALPLGRDYAHPQRDAAALAGLIRELRGFDVVHGHAAKAGVLARLAAASRRLPAIYTPHCLPFVGDVSARRRRFGLAAERLLGPLTAGLICVCEDERRIATEARVVEPDRLIVVHNGCPPPDPGLTADPALAALRAGGLLVGAVTVLRRQKSVEVLLDAVPELLGRVPAARVAVVGDGPERAALQARAARLGLDGRLAFLPFSAPAARHLQALDVYALPSAWEAFPIGVLEAQACGVPQVATDVGGTREAVAPDTGLLVPPGDPRRLAAALAELLLDPARRARMAAASRARHAERFTAERMVRETAAAYDAVLSRAAARRRAARPARRS